MTKMDAFSGERIFVDTNILFYATSPHVEQVVVAREKLTALAAENERYISGQVLREFANVVLHTARILKHDWPVTQRNLQENLLRFQADFNVLFEDEPTVRLWQTLLPAATGGKRVYDLNIVATLRRHGLRHLFTHNVGDFVAFPDLVLIPLDLPR